MGDPAPCGEGDDAPEDSVALVRRAQAGEREAVEGLLRMHLPRLRAFVRLRAGDELRARESASDIVQSVCRELLQELGSLEYRDEGAFRQWLYQAAEHKIRNRARYWRATRRDGRREVDDATLEELAQSYGAFCTPSGAAMLRERISAVERAFSRLSPRHRQVISLAKVAGLSHRAIGAQLELNEGAVRALLYRALAELASHLEDSPPS